MVKFNQQHQQDWTLQQLITWYFIIYLLGLSNGNQRLNWTSHPRRSCVNQKIISINYLRLVQIRLRLTIWHAPGSRVQRVDLPMPKHHSRFYCWCANKAELQWLAAVIASHAKDFEKLSFLAHQPLAAAQPSCCDLWIMIRQFSYPTTQSSWHVTYNSPGELSWRNR